MSNFYNKDYILLTKDNNFKISPRNYGKFYYIIERKINFLKNQLINLGNSNSDIDLKEKIGYQIDILEDLLFEFNKKGII